MFDIGFDRVISFVSIGGAIAVASSVAGWQIPCAIGGAVFGVIVALYTIADAVAKRKDSP